MAKKKNRGVSASLRWQVFARDNFTCRYCGSQAGQNSVQLHADHVISVADGGNDSMDNLITACQACNGGKGAKSLTQLPDAGDVAERMIERAESIQKQADAIRLALEQEREMEQQAVNLKCQAYGVDRVEMATGEKGIIIRLCREFGTETVLDWYRIAASKDVYENRAIKYVCGIARNVRQAAKEREDA